MSIGRLHVLTDSIRRQRFSPTEVAQLACAGGADVIQFRQKEGSARERFSVLREVARVCADADVNLVVNDHLDLALAVGADGIHLGQDDLPIESARRVLSRHGGPTKLIGATCTNLGQARLAVREGADYIGFGPVFETKTKANPASVKGLEGLAEVCQAISIPVIAIGGITVVCVQSVLEAGAHGVAVMSAVTLADEPRWATEQFRKAMDGFMG